MADLNSGRMEIYGLGHGVMAGNVYAQDILAKLPSYSYHIAASKYSYHIFRNSHGPFDCYDSIGSNQERFSELRLEIQPAVTRSICSIEEIKAKTLAGSIFQASLSVEWDCHRIDVHFPVNHINVHSTQDSFQIETGPVLVPNAGPLGDGNRDWKERKLNLAYVFFNCWNKAEFLLWQPIQKTGELRVTKTRTFSSRCTIPAELKLMAEELSAGE